MKELYRSISMDEGRIGVVERPGGSYVITKKTTLKEVVNMVEMGAHLENAKKFEWQGESYKVVIPKIVTWDQTTETLTLEAKDGKNLEALLFLPNNNRKQIVDLTYEFLNWMKSTGTFWRAAAPRHIIIDSKQKEISLLDFERPACLREDRFSEKEFNERLAGLVHEEFSAFLFGDEQDMVFPNIWSLENPNEIISLDTIHGKRIKLLLNNFFGPIGETVRKDQLYFVYKFMSSIATPFLIQGRPFYPFKAMDKNTRNTEDYVKTVLDLSKLERSAWPEYLKYENN